MVRCVISPDPPHIICKRFLTSSVSPGESTLDVGCGSGDLLIELKNLGAEVRGVEIDPSLIDACCGRGLDVQRGSAERLPFPVESFDRIVCSVVVPYTDEKQAVAEWARVVKPGGRIFATYHGLGYGLHYLMRGPGVKRRIYGLRMLLNTAWYQVMGRKIPGFFGDTLCQTNPQLRSYYSRFGLVLERETLAATFLGFPHVICHQLVKPPAANSDQRPAGAAQFPSRFASLK